MQLSLLVQFPDSNDYQSFERNAVGIIPQSPPNRPAASLRYYAAERESVTADIGLHIDAAYDLSLLGLQDLLGESVRLRVTFGEVTGGFWSSYG